MKGTYGMIIWDEVFTATKPKTNAKKTRSAVVMKIWIAHSGEIVRRFVGVRGRATCGEAMFEWEEGDGER